MWSLIYVANKLCVGSVCYKVVNRSMLHAYLMWDVG